MADNPKKKKVTRTMKVTMDEDEFEKYDKGITHSDKGLRDKKGKLSALPDITPISEDDLPKRTVIKRETVFVEKKEPTLLEMLKQDAKFELRRFIVGKAEEFIYNPHKRKEIIENVKCIYRDYIKPAVSGEIKATKIITKAEEKKTKNTNLVEAPIDSSDNNDSKIVVSEEQAEILLSATKKKAQELSMMLTMLSMIYIKDDKTENEYKLEQEYLKQLTSDEMTKTMKQIIEHKELLDKETVALFTDFLNGYIRHDNELIPFKYNNEDSQ